MVRTKCILLIILALFYCSLGFILPSTPLAQELTGDTNLRGTLRIVELWAVNRSAMMNYAEGLIMLDKDNNFVPCLAESWKWIGERTIEFRLRQGVLFQNGGCSTLKQ